MDPEQTFLRVHAGPSKLMFQLLVSPICHTLEYPLPRRRSRVLLPPHHAHQIRAAGHRISEREAGRIMGISSKWIKSLVGIRKQEKGHNAEKQEKDEMLRAVKLYAGIKSF